MLPIARHLFLRERRNTNAHICGVVQYDVKEDNKYKSLRGVEAKLKLQNAILVYFHE